MDGVDVLGPRRRRGRMQRKLHDAYPRVVVSDVPLTRKHEYSCTMAYQPIVDVTAPRTVAYEALARGLHNEPASTVLREIADDDTEVSAEQRCGTLAVEIAVTLGIVAAEADLYINFSPNGTSLESSALCSAIEAAERAGLSLDRLIMEITEREPLRRPAELRRTLAPYRARGLRVAIDDFGAGYAGLSALAAFQPEIVKVDMALTREIEQSRPKQVIVGSVLAMCGELGIEVIAEGVEQAAQRGTLADLGVRYMQGNLFSEPGFERLPLWPV